MKKIKKFPGLWNMRGTNFVWICKLFSATVSIVQLLYNWIAFYLRGYMGFKGRKKIFFLFFF